MLGAGVVTFGANSNSQILIAAMLAVAGLGTGICVMLEIPLLPFVRFAFVASYFFKGEVNLFKIDETQDPSGLNVSLALLTGLTLLIYDFVFTAENPEETKIPSHFWLLSGGLFLSAVFSVLYSGSQMLGWFGLASLATSLLTAYVIAAHFGRSRERVGELILFVAAGLIFTGAAALSQYAINFPTNLDFFGTGTEDEMLGTQSQALSRVPAFLRTPTEMAWLVSAFVPLVFAPVFCAVKDFGRRRKMLLAATTAASVIAVILSLARGSWFGTLAAAAIVLIGGWFAFTPEERRARVVPIGATALLAIVFFAPFAERIYERLTADDDGSAAIRLPLLEVAGRIIDDNPLVGVGINNYRQTMTKYDETGIFVSQVFPAPVHNLFAHVTAEIGVIGGVLFGLLIVAALIENGRTMTAGDRWLFALGLAVAAGLVAFIISAMKEPGSLGSTRPPMRTLFFLFGLTLALSRLRRSAV